MPVSPAKIREYQREVTEALIAIGNPALGKAIQHDRGSQLPHLGISFPNLRRRVLQGFSFDALPEPDVLTIWDALWRNAQHGDVLFAALEHYLPVVRKRAMPGLWPMARHWVERVDNWCHSDGLSAIYAWLLERHPDALYPQLVAWNRAEGQWQRRTSLVSLIHYSGKHAVFMPVNKVLPLITACLADPRQHVQTAVGWVLREMGNVHAREITDYLESHARQLSTTAFARAIERKDAPARARLRALRNAHQL